MGHCIDICAAEGASEGVVDRAPRGVPGRVSGPPARTYRGGCPCGAVRYELEIDGYARQAGELTVRASRFKLVAGDDRLSGHQFATWGVHHFYCESCGVCSFRHHNPEQHEAEFYSVHWQCLDA